MASVILQKHQSLMDIALQECGDATALFEIAMLNGISPTEMPIPGTAIKVPNPFKKNNVRYFFERLVKPATLDDEAALAPGGIGYMGMGINFKIS